MAKTYQYNDDELAGIVYQEIANADGADSDERQAHVQQALDYYYNRTRGDEKDGESHVQSSDLADMTNAVLAQLTPMISTDALVAFEADGEEDEDQVRMETQAVNDCVLQKNPGYIELQQCLKDACLSWNTFAKVWAEDKEEVEARHVVGRKADLNRMAAAIRQNGGDAEVTDYDDEDREGTITVKTRTRKFRWRAVDPANFLYESGWDSIELQDIRFCAERDTPTKSDLVEEGYDAALVKDLPPHNQDTEAAQTARNRDSDPLNQPQTPETEQVERYCCLLKIDMDGDGIAEQWQITVAGDKSSGSVLEKEQVQWVPFVAGAIFIASHRLQGEDLHDRLKQTQDIKTGTLRRWMDGHYNAVWPRLGAQENNVSEDVDDMRSGATIWTKGPPGDALLPFQGADIGASCQALLNYEDQRRTERAGAALDMQAADAQLVGETMGGIMKQYSVKEQLTAMMAKNLAETLIRGIYMLMHRTMRTFSRQKVKVTLRGQAQMVNPTEWPVRTDLSVMPGLTPTERASMEQAMTGLMQWQQGVMQQGKTGILASDETQYRIALDYARSKGVPNPEQYMIDPASDAARQAAQQQAEQAQQQQQMQMQMLQMQVQMAQAQLEIEREKNRTKLFSDLYQADLDAMLKQAELDQDGEQQRTELIERARTSAAQTSSQAAGAGAGSNGGGSA